MFNFRAGGRGAEIDIIPPEHRSVAIRRHAFADANGIVDVEFETLRGRFGKPGLVEVRRPSSPVESGRPEKHRSTPLLDAGPLLHKYGFAVLVIALSLATFWITGGHALAKRSAATASIDILAGDKAD